MHTCAEWGINLLPYCRRFVLLPLVVIGLSFTWSGPACLAQRAVVQSLAGDWQISSDDRQTWKTVNVPGTFEEQIDRKFDGVAWLRRSIDPVTIPPGQRLVLHFDAVATAAKVWWNGELLGEHLGGWTPFRVDLTEAARKVGGGPWELLVQVDEKVGHNTQGFLPIIAPHFGGIWQPVRLLRVPEGAIDDLRCLAWGNLESGKIDLEVPFAWGLPQPGDTLAVATRLLNDKQWSRELVFPLGVETGARRPNAGGVVRDGVARLSVPLLAENGSGPLVPRRWSPSSPARYEVRLQLKRGGEVHDTHLLPAAFRKLEIRGRRLILNDQPLSVRGLLNWGYQQGRTAPAIDPEVMEREIQFARDRGFNLMKFCLWIPPRRYLELADEAGLLVWMEYPAWHPRFTPEFLAELRREYDEFFLFDRNHPSIILRSLTCETGQGADLQVIQSLYDQCHARVPNAVVEDDSSWIEWNRVHDFYDDHPYGNNHTWPATLERLNGFIAQRAAKPLMLGEAIAADTWSGPTSPDEPTPDMLTPPISAAGNREWLLRMHDILSPGSLSSLRTDSLRYALLMRKYQIETYRRDVPEGGYVVSVIRDFSLAGMGLIDYQNQPKWEPADWAWQGDTMLLLRTAADRRSFTAGEPLRGEVLVSHFGPQPLPRGRLTLRWDSEAGETRQIGLSDAVRVGAVERVLEFSWPAPAVTTPRSVTLHATYEAGSQRWENRWPVWIVPAASPSLPALAAHTSWDLPAGELGISPALPWESLPPEPGKRPIVLARRVDERLLQHLADGGRVLLLPDDGPRSFALRQHWFLRGGPLVDAGWTNAAVPREMLVELQHFDLAGPVVGELQDLEALRPLFVLWDNHDIPQVKTHGLVFEMPVGQGWLLVSALRHTGAENAAGRYLFAQLAQRRAVLDPPVGEQGQQNLQRLRDELLRRELALGESTWHFQPDGEHQGVERQWHTGQFDDAGWPEIRIDRHWEAQGYETLDGWAWYRATVRLPEDWPQGRCYLNFTGADDYYRVYVNGQVVGSGGDIATRQTAFEERKSHDIAAHVRPGEEVRIAIEVYDWYGAGGIFRPVTLSTTPLAARPPLLK